MSGFTFLDLADFLAIYDRIALMLGSAKQKDIATALGLAPSHVNNLLAAANGKQLPKGPKALPFKQLIAWAVERGISVDWLLTGRGEPTATPATPKENLKLEDSRCEPNQTENAELTRPFARFEQEAELLGAETSAWLLRQAVTNSQRWPELVACLWEFRNEWETGGKPPMEREPPAQDEAGRAGEKASGGKG